MLIHPSTHYRVLSLILMAFSITVNTRFAGSPKGTFLEDLTDLVVGQSTGAPNSKKISKIAVYAGGIIDSVRITYKAENVPTPLTVQHGGPGGVEVLSFDISADEKLVAVYGTRLVSPSPWNERHISQLSFIVVKSSGDVPTTKVYTATGNYIAPTEKFELSFPLTTASSYTFQPQGIQDSYLEGIGFSNVSFKAD
ncbi:hypothetical protein V8E53_012557 [Lactarius tabidus]